MPSLDTVGEARHFGKIIFLRLDHTLALPHTFKAELAVLPLIIIDSVNVLASVKSIEMRSYFTYCKIKRLATIPNISHDIQNVNDLCFRKLADGDVKVVFVMAVV